MNRAASAAASATLQLPLAVYPGINRFALDLVSGREPATRYLPRSEWPVSADGERSSALADALVRSNTAWGNDVKTEVERWQRGEAVTIVAGQQVCFGGGPLLIPVKLASALALRNELAARGVAATVFFWLATEDHDYDEVASLSVPVRGARIRLRARDRRSDLRQMVGSVVIPAELREGLIEALQIEPPSWLREGITFRDSFAELISAAFAGRGVVLVDALLPELRSAGEELLRSIAGNLDEAERALDSRSAELQSHGYVPQLVPSADGGYALLYELRRDVRVPWRGGDLPAAAQISTGAAARPLLQDFVLGSGIFVGGPAEVAYYAQVSALHRHFGVSLPRVALRAHLLAAPEKVLRTIEKYHLQPADLFDAPDRIAARLDPEAAERMRQAVSDAEERLSEELNFLRNLVAAADPGMRRSLERRLRRIRFHFDRLEEQAVRAAARSDSERYRAIARLVETLAPGGEPQDRKSSWLPLWLQYGRHFIDRLIEEVRPDGDRVILLGL